MSPSGTSSLTVDATLTGVAPDTWRFGTVTLTPPAGSTASTARIPVAARDAGADVPAAVSVRASRPDGSVAVTSRFADPATAADATVTAQGMSRGPAVTQTVQQSLYTSAYDSRASLTKTPLNVPPGTSRAIVEIDSPAPDIDLYVGTGNTPTAATQVCASATASSQETCDLLVNVASGFTGWIGVHGYDVGAGSAEYELRITFVGEDDDTLTADAEVQDKEVTTTVAWQDDRIERGQVWYGMITTTAGKDTYRTPLTLGRTSTDVVRSQSASTASFGASVTHTVAFTPTVSNVEQTYEFSETLPNGVTRVAVLEEPAPLTHDGATTTWRITVPPGSSETVRYVYTAKATDNDLLDGAELQHTATHRRLGGTARTDVASVVLQMTDAPLVQPLTSVGEGVREVSVALERDWTLALLDDNIATSRLDVDGGSYSVEPGGVLRFTPTAGRHGDASPVSYRVTDAVGRHASSTFAATVWPTAPGVQDKSTRGGASQRVSVTVDPWQRLSLLDGSRATDRLTTSAGTYTVAGNDLTFEGARGVSGPASPVRFRVSDSYGRSSESTWSLIVDGAVPSPAPTPGPGAGTGTTPDTGTGTAPQPTTRPTPTAKPTPHPTAKPAPKAVAKARTKLTVKLSKKIQRRGKTPATARITVKSAKGQAKGKVFVRVNGKLTKTIKVSKNRTVRVKLSKKLTRGRKTVRVTFVPAATGPSKKATARITLRVKR